MKKTWYYAEGSKKAELWTILHLPYTFMALSFLAIGFSISKPVNYTVLAGALVAYFLGLGVAAHALDQLPSVKGSKYVKLLTPLELKVVGIGGLVVAFIIGTIFIFNWQAWHMIWLMPLQGLFAVAYPTSKPLKIFHTDTSFAFSFGALPCLVGFYANGLTFSPIIISFMMLCFCLSQLEIVLSRGARNLRSSGVFDESLRRMEKGLKLLCTACYILAISVFIM